jgi:site-specific DNA-methyltransferase (adenine-specific)
MIELHNIDCMELMKRYPDNYFDLAIVDPPYGIGNFWCGGDAGAQVNIKKLRSKEREWNNIIPTKYYFDELKRVSKNWIIWGWNYYTDLLGPTNSLIYWHKKMGAPNYSDGELASTSFKHKVKTFVYPLAKDNSNRTHPCQKPLALYRWLLDNYAKQGDKILDTHLGSGSSAIAAYQLGYDFVGCELDKDYFQAMQKRVKQAMKQTNLFQSVEEKQAEQIKIF